MHVKLPTTQFLFQLAHIFQEKIFFYMSKNINELIG